MANVMPFGSRQRNAAGRRLLDVVASVLEELVSASAKTMGDDSSTRKVTKFHGLRAPGIAVPEYLERVSKFSGCSNECFVLSLIYVDRLITKDKLRLDHLNVHRVIITAVMLSAKFFDDHYLDNAHYAAVGGVPKAEMNSLELEFLFMLEFQLHVSPDDYLRYFDALKRKLGPEGAVLGSGIVEDLPDMVSPSNPLEKSPTLSTTTTGTQHDAAPVAASGWSS